MKCQHSLRSRRLVPALVGASTVLLVACTGDAPVAPAEPASRAEPVARWSETLRVRDGVSYRLLERSVPLFLDPPQEVGALIVGDAAVARRARLLESRSVDPLASLAANASNSDAVTLLARSDVQFDNSIANFFTTATINVTNPADYRLGLLTKDVEHTIGLQGDRPGTPFTRRRSLQASQGPSIQSHTTAWPGIDAGPRCSVAAQERAVVNLKLDRVVFGPIMEPQTSNVASSGGDVLQRPCFDSPSDFCNSLDACGDHDSGTPPPLGGGGGAGSAVSGTVFGFTQAGWQNRYCWVTDWYDPQGNYIETTVDWCSI